MFRADFENAGSEPDISKRSAASRDCLLVARTTASACARKLSHERVLAHSLPSLLYQYRSRDRRPSPYSPSAVTPSPLCHAIAPLEHVLDTFLASADVDARPHIQTEHVSRSSSQLSREHVLLSKTHYKQG